MIFMIYEEHEPPTSEVQLERVFTPLRLVERDRLRVRLTFDLRCRGWLPISQVWPKLQEHVHGGLH
jgi:hypothetical protein